MSFHYLRLYLCLESCVSCVSLCLCPCLCVCVYVRLWGTIVRTKRDERRSAVVLLHVQSSVVGNKHVLLRCTIVRKEHDALRSIVDSTRCSKASLSLCVMLVWFVVHFTRLSSPFQNALCVSLHRIRKCKNPSAVFCVLIHGFEHIRIKYVFPLLPPRMIWKIPELLVFPVFSDSWDSKTLELHSFPVSADSWHSKKLDINRPHQRKLSEHTADPPPAVGGYRPRNTYGTFFFFNHCIRTS